jgi:hypothetical protein
METGRGITLGVSLAWLSVTTSDRNKPIIAAVLGASLLILTSCLLEL